MTISAAPITSGEDIQTTVFALEVVAFLQGRVREDEIDWDEDSLVDWYIETVVDPQDREAYREEYRTALDEAKGAVLSQLVIEIDNKVQVLGNVYPFAAAMEEGILLRRKDDADCLPQTVCYLWLALFRGSQEKTDFLMVSAAQKATIRQKFAKVFEIIAAFALLGRADGPAWYFGASRSPAKLLRILRHVTRRVGSGLVKSLDQLQLNQANDNDGGIDAILIERQDDSTAFLVGATIQLSDRRKKIIGPEAVDRFNDYFVNRMTVATRGVLAVPYERSEREKINCASKNCLYFHAGLIIEYLGNAANSRPRETRHLRLALRDISRSAIEDLTLNDNPTLEACAWV